MSCSRQVNIFSPHKSCEPPRHFIAIRFSIVYSLNSHDIHVLKYMCAGIINMRKIRMPIF